MKRPFIFILVLSFSIIVIPVVSSLLLYRGTNTDANKTDKVEVKSKSSKEITYEKVDKDSPIISVYNVDENKTVKMDMEEYLYGVVRCHRYLMKRH